MNFKDKHILIVDDITENIEVVIQTLKVLECHFSYAKNGMEAIKRVEQNNPDLILLDIMMPEIDGFETCKILKENKETKHIPIIFLSAFNAIENITKGFELGAVDYISKPFQSKELIARVTTHLKLRAYEQEQEKAIDLLKLELNDRENLLLEQTKMASMGEMLENIAHQWRQPLSVITTAATGLEVQSTIESLNPDILEDGLKNIIKSAEHLSQTINDFRSFYCGDQAKTYFRIDDAINQAFEIIPIEKNLKIDVVLDIHHDEVLAFKNELIHVFLNLISNTKDALKEIKGEKILKISTFKTDNKITIEFVDNAGGIEESILPKIFDHKFSTKLHVGGTGIGLYMSKLIIDKIGGSISASNVEFTHDGKSYKGAKFEIILDTE